MQLNIYIIYNAGHNDTSIEIDSVDIALGIKKRVLFWTFRKRADV